MVPIAFNFLVIVHATVTPYLSMVLINSSLARSQKLKNLNNLAQGKVRLALFAVRTQRLREHLQTRWDMYEPSGAMSGSGSADMSRSWVRGGC